jgi:hypothetical protein
LWRFPIVNVLISASNLLYLREKCEPPMWLV